MEILKVFCDGGARGNPGPAASAFVVFDKEGNLVFKQGKLIGNSTNNIAEYTAVLMAIEWLVRNGKVGNVMFFLDSELVVKQLLGAYRVKNKNLLSLSLKIQKLRQKFPGKLIFQHIRRSENAIADSLVNKILDSSKAKK
jgi:ribonuclease HI